MEYEFQGRRAPRCVGLARGVGVGGVADPITTRAAGPLGCSKPGGVHKDRLSLVVLTHSERHVWPNCPRYAFVSRDTPPHAVLPLTRFRRGPTATHLAGPLSPRIVYAIPTSP